MAKKISREEWERRVLLALSDRFNFHGWEGDKFGAREKVSISCAMHGTKSSPMASTVASGNFGCKICAGNNLISESERIGQISSIDGISFLRWESKYSGAKSKALVRCENDGNEWIATIDDLVNGGTRCPSCFAERRGESRRNGRDKAEMMIRNSSNINFIRWNCEYKNAHSIAVVSCKNKLCGHEWRTSLNNIVYGGTSCPRCAKYGFQLDKKGYLYALRSECGLYLKVGISNKPKVRHAQLEKRTPFKFNLVEQISGGGVKIYELEKHFHEKYESAGFVGFDGCTEWLICSDELLSELRRISIESEHE